MKIVYQHIAPISNVLFAGDPMYFLETIAGLKGENLTTAVLKHLLTNSGEVRSMLVNLLKHELSSSEVPSFRNGIICETEFEVSVESSTKDDTKIYSEFTNEDGTTSTVEPDSEDGSREKARIDLLIAADNCLICLENKLWAPIQCNQPAKYLSALQEPENEQRRGMPLLCIVLSPEARRGELGRAIEKQGIEHPLIQLTWEQICRGLSGIKNDATSNQVVIGFLHEYLQDYIGHISIPKDRVVGRVMVGNQFQYELLAKFQKLIENCDGFTIRKLSAAKRYLGFGFDYTHDQTVHPNWIGFEMVDGSLVLSMHSATLAIIPKDAIKTLDHQLPYCSAFELDPDPWPNTMASWREALQPSLKAIEEAVS